MTGPHVMKLLNVLHKGMGFNIRKKKTHHQREIALYAILSNEIRHERHQTSTPVISGCVVVSKERFIT